MSEHMKCNICNQLTTQAHMSGSKLFPASPELTVTWQILNRGNLKYIKKKTEQNEKQTNKKVDSTVKLVTYFA